MRTPRLPVVDWTDAPADLNGLVRFAERRNLVSARVPSHFKRSQSTTPVYETHSVVCFPQYARPPSHTYCCLQCPQDAQYLTGRYGYIAVQADDAWHFRLFPPIWLNPKRDSATSARLYVRTNPGNTVRSNLVFGVKVAVRHIAFWSALIDQTLSECNFTERLHVAT